MRLIVFDEVEIPGGTDQVAVCICTGLEETVISTSGNHNPLSPEKRLELFERLQRFTSFWLYAAYSSRPFELLPRPWLAATTFEGISDYARRGLETLPDHLPEVLSPLPVEDLVYGPINPTESHILGATIMGDDPETSVVDRHLVDHRYRNLLVLGAGLALFHRALAGGPERAGGDFAPGEVFGQTRGRVL